MLWWRGNGPLYLVLHNNITVIIAIVIIVKAGELVCEIRIEMLQGMKMGPVCLGAFAL
jgi:hypothetical protein